MKHFIFFFHMLAFLIGVTGIILSYFAYIKYNTKLIKHYIIFIIALTIILLEQTLTSYKIINEVQSFYLNVVLNIISYLASGVIIYFLPLFAHEFIEKEWTSRKKIFFKIGAFIPICSVLIYYIFSYKKFIVILSGSILFSAIFYSLVFIYLNYKFIKLEYKKIIVKIFLTAALIFFPYMYLDTRTEQIEFLSNLFPYGLLSLPLFYMLWNLLSIYFGIKYLKNNLAEFNNEESHNIIEAHDKREEFFQKFNITNREKEIILLLMKGHTYNQLAEELVISLTTVKTHVHNIYSKAGVRNKIQLIHLINGEEIL